METPKDGRTIGDGSEFEVVPGKWNAPETITEPLVLECRRWLEALSKAEGTAQDGRIRNWLMKLLGGLAGNHSEDTVRMKLAAFTFALAEFPAYCFDDAVLRRAQKHFKSFWPSAGELIEFMEAYQGEIRVRAQRAYKIIDIGPRRPGQSPRGRPWAEGGAEDHAQFLREKQDRERRELVEIMRQRDLAEGRTPADTSVPPRIDGEDDKAYVKRIVSVIGDRISVGAKARKADEERYRRAKQMDEAEKREVPPAGRKPSPPHSAEKIRESAAAFRATHEQGPPPPQQGSHPPDAPGVSQTAHFVKPEDLDSERLAGMTPDFTSGDEP